MAKPRWYRFLLGLLVTLWVSGGLIAGAVWVGPHMFALESSEDWTHLSVATQNQWSMTHILSESCDCSSAVLKSLINRNIQAPKENVIWITKSASSTPVDEIKLLQDKGYQIRQISRESLPSQDIAVPALVIHNPKGEVIYAGGYSEHKDYSVNQVRDVEIFENLKMGRPTSRLPVFGCVTTKKYETLVSSNFFKMKRQ
jgi:hypothetical protein